MKFFQLSRAEILNLSEAINKCDCQTKRLPLGEIPKRPFVKKDNRAAFTGITFLSFNKLSNLASFQIIHIINPDML